MPKRGSWWDNREDLGFRIADSEMERAEDNSGGISEFVEAILFVLCAA